MGYYITGILNLKAHTLFIYILWILFPTTFPHSSEWRDEARNLIWMGFHYLPEFSTGFHVQLSIKFLPLAESNWEERPSHLLQNHPPFCFINKSPIIYCWQCGHMETCPGAFMCSRCDACAIAYEWTNRRGLWEERRGGKMIPRQGEFLAAMGGTQWRCP